MADYSAILNDALDIPSIEHTFSFSNDMLNPAIHELLKRTYRREIVVICRDKKNARCLLDEMVDCLHTDIDKVDHFRGIVETGYDRWIFIGVNDLDIKLKGRDRTEVVWGHEFERALEIYKERYK